MIRKDFIELTKNIRSIYPSFKGYDDLINYKYEEVKKNFLLHTGTDEPTYEELTNGLRYENEKEVLMQCELCGSKIPYTTWEEFEEHHRRCSKIDFINRQAKELKGVGIDKEYYKSMSDEELNERYDKIMKNWQLTHSSLSIGSILNKL